MKIFRLKKMSLPKIAVFVTGLAAAAFVATVSQQEAHATPRASSCAGCHIGSTSAATTATPSTITPVAGATYTVAITLAANPNGGNSGYGITPVTAGTGSTFGGNTGADLSFTATMTAPAAAGTYSYTVYTNQGSKATGQTGSAAYTITVTGGSATTPPPTTTSTPTVTTPPATTPPVTTPPVTTNIHGPYALNSAQCGTCHRAHTAKAPNLLKSGSPASLGSQSTLCLGCHDGTGASPAVKIQYDLVRPVNNATAREYYSHDAVDATPAIAPHTQSGLNEFGDVVNRHSECADCHNSHQATATDPRDSAQKADGWDVSRRLAGVSGVSVVNGAAGAAPAYTFLSGTADSVIDPITREYQLCFKCHSGFTKLPPPIAGKPSKDFLDKGVEFNPANTSFHPVEAAGKNNTAAMQASLAGASEYKLWDFTVASTIRCMNCHASSATPGTLPLPQPGSALAPHTSSNRGILIRNYRDRVLKPMSGTDAAYSAGDFALCYVCHGQAPFGPDGESSSATNFNYHSKHLTGIIGKGSPGTDIDTANDGGGNAVCAECHFRLHSTTNKVGAQTLTGDPVTGSRLVNFAPNVTASGGVISWETTSTGSGSCTLTCHGQEHTAGEYTYGP